MQVNRQGISYCRNSSLSCTWYQPKLSSQPSSLLLALYYLMIYSKSKPPHPLLSYNLHKSITQSPYLTLRYFDFFFYWILWTALSLDRQPKSEDRQTDRYPDRQTGQQWKCENYNAERYRRKWRENDKKCQSRKINGSIFPRLNRNGGSFLPELKLSGMSANMDLESFYQELFAEYRASVRCFLFF